LIKLARNREKTNRSQFNNLLKNTGLELMSGVGPLLQQLTPEHRIAGAFLVRYFAHMGDFEAMEKDCVAHLAEGIPEVPPQVLSAMADDMVNDVAQELDKRTPKEAG
jgi:hypothetical protein